MMQRFILAIGLAFLSGPAYAQAQSTPAPGQQPGTTNGIPNTTLSTETSPSTGPRSREAEMQSNSAAPANDSAMATAPETTMPATERAHYPLCKAGEFDHCMEPGNGAGSKHHRLHRRR